VASGTFEGSRLVRVWEAATGKKVWEWDMGDTEVAFSPDGHWLALATGRFAPVGSECRLYHVGTWEPGPRVPLPRSSSSPAKLLYSPDGKLLALAANATEVRLLEPDTLEEVATLMVPEPLLVSWMAFSPDGSQLAAAASSRVQLWDLRAVRARLDTMGLDWMHDGYPPAPPRPARAGTIKVME
jgi:WD40 repeat protein